MRRTLALIAAAVALVLTHSTPAYAETRERLDPLDDMGPIYGKTAEQVRAYDITKLRVRNGTVNIVATVWMRTLAPRKPVGLTFRMSKGGLTYIVTTRRYANRSLSKPRLWVFPENYNDPYQAIPCGITATWGAGGTRQVKVVVPQACLGGVVNDFWVYSAPWVLGQDYYDATRSPFVVRYG